MDAAERIDAHWSRFLGVPESALHSPAIVITPHAALHGYHGVWFFVRDRSAVVSAPRELIDRLERNLGQAVAQELLSPATAVRTLGDVAGVVVGPSFQGWLPADRFHRVTTDGVRRLDQSDADAVRRFQASCSSDEWQHGGIDPTLADVWGSFNANEIVALGQLRSQPNGAVDPCVITHLDHRGQGHALRLTSAMVEAARAQGQLVLYQTLMSNAAAIAIARRLGFAHYATLVAVRLARGSE